MALRLKRLDAPALHDVGIHYMDVATVVHIDNLIYDFSRGSLVYQCTDICHLITSPLYESVDVELTTATNSNKSTSGVRFNY